MARLIQTIALSQILLCILLTHVRAQDLKQIDSQIQDAIAKKKYEQAGLLVDKAIATLTLPAQQRIQGNYLATKGDLELRQKKYLKIIEYACKADNILDKYPPDLISINNLVTLGYAYLRTGDEEYESVSFEKFEKAEKRQAKLKSVQSATMLGDRYMSISDELMKPAKPESYAPFTAVRLYGIAAGLFEKGSDSGKVRLARSKFLALMEKIQRDEDEEDAANDDEEDDDDKPQKNEEKSDNKSSNKKPAPGKKSNEEALVVRNPYLALGAEMPRVKNNMTEGELKKSFEQCIAQNGEKSAASAVCHSTAGNFYRTVKVDFGKAQKHFEDAISILKKLNALDTPLAASCRKELMFVYMQSGQYAKVAAQVRENHNLVKGLQRLAFNLGGTEDDNEAYAGLDMGMQMTLSFTDFIQKKKQSPDTVMSKLSYDADLYLNSLLFDETRRERDFIKAQNNRQITELYESWLIQRQRIPNLPVAQKESALTKAEEIRDDLEELLTKVSKAKPVQEEISWNQIRKSLAPDQAAVSFVRFRSFSAIASPLTEFSNKPEDILYAAMVIRPDYSAPRFVSLGNEVQLNELLARPDLYAKEQERGFARIAYGDSLYRLVWRPIDKLLGGVNRVYYSAQGLLTRVAFAALPLPGTTSETPVVNQYLDGKYELHQLFSTKQLVAGITPFHFERRMSVVLFGGVDYGTAGPESVPAPKNKASLTSLQTAIEKAHLRPFAPLAATIKEVNEIHRTLPKSELITDKEASEKRFRQFSGHSPDILHLATHGLYLRPDAKQTDQSQDEAYMRSALVLSGANELWQMKSIPVNGEDGLLTAYEIQYQDLSQTQLLVLSACETALGDLRGSEGAFGLPRAFRMAGVKKLLLSLWPVDDSVTKQLMTSFYAKIASGMEVHAAFRDAQRAIQKKYAQPKLWAPFVLIE